jgi:hypothetical protein
MVQAVLARLYTGLTDSNPSRGMDGLRPRLFLTVFSRTVQLKRKNDVLFTGHTESHGALVALLLHIQEVLGIDHASKTDYSNSVFRKCLQENSGIQAETASVTTLPNYL